MESLETLVARRRELLAARQAEFDARMAILETSEAAGRQRLDEGESAQYRQRTNAIIELDRELDRVEDRIAELNRE